MSRARHVSRRHRLRPALWAGTVLAALLQCQPAAAVESGLTGPAVMLEFRTIYNTMNGTGIFIEFKPTTPANPMPGCYSDIGGYLKYTESNFDRMWALILTLYARGPTLASVVYDRYPEYSGTWSLCNIRGIYIRPPA